MNADNFKKFLPYFLLIGALVAPIFMDVLLAQPTSGPPIGGGVTGNQPPCFDPPCIPIDGGLGFLIAAGAALGGKKIYDATSKKDSK